MKRLFILFLGISLSLFSYSCDNDDDMPQPNAELGCTDEKSLSFNFSADTDDGSCEYSKITLYAQYNLFQNTPITKIDISINGSYAGSINNGFIWPNSPGNCSSEGTVTYQFQDSTPIDWNATLFLANGQTISTGGTKAPNRTFECIKINVTI